MPAQLLYSNSVLSHLSLLTYKNIPTQLLSFKVKILVIGVSIGGPLALSQLLQGFPRNLRVPIVIVQHMPPVFTTRLAGRLSSSMSNSRT